MPVPAKMSAILPDPVHGHSGVAQVIEPVRAGRCQREVVPARGACVLARLARERPRDHPGDGEVADQQLAGDAAGRVQLFDRHRVLVGGDLEHGVGRRVHDPVAGSLVLLSQPLDDLGARGGHVSDHAPPGGLGEAIEQVGREAVGEGRETAAR